MKTAEFCANLERLLASRTPEARLQEAVRAIAGFFSVTPEEVAVFSLDENEAILRFRWPETLSQMGFIPLCSRDSLAVRTLRENCAAICNDFASVRHASAFEGIRLGPGQSEKLPIQKILSVPIAAAGTPAGVVQVSRKAARPAAVADFTISDQTALAEIAKAFARYLLP